MYQNKIYIFLLTNVFVVFLFCFTLFFSLPSNVLIKREPGLIRDFVNSIWAQQFGFFTRDTQHDQTQVYQFSNDNKVYSLIRTPQNSIENLYGLSRNQRAQAPELARLLNDPTIHYSDCAGVSFENCLFNNKKLLIQKIINAIPMPTICGDIFLVIGKINDWSYRQLIPDTYIGEKISHVSVQCTRLSAINR